MAYQLTQDCIDMDVEMSATAHAVLVVLCRHADENGQNCFPSAPVIMKKSHLFERTVRKAIKELEAAGWISVTQAVGMPRHFSISVDRIREATPAKNVPPVQSDTPAKNVPPDKNVPPYINRPEPRTKIAGEGVQKCTGTGAKNSPLRDQLREQEKDREETAPASSPESGTCDVTASDLCPSVDAFALSSETPQAAEKPKKGKKAKKGNAEEVDFYDLPESMIRDWKTHRGTTAKITQTVVDAFRREAEKVGKTLEFAVRYSIEHNWRGFFAKWYLKEETKSGGESISNVGTLPDQSRNPFYFPDGGRPNRKTTEVPRDYDATAEASDLVGRMLG